MVWEYWIGVVKCEMSVKFFVRYFIERLKDLVKLKD